MLVMSRILGSEAFGRSSKLRRSDALFGAGPLRRSGWLLCMAGRWV